MIEYTVRIYGVDVKKMWRNLNWNNRHRRLTATEIASQSRIVDYYPAPKSRLMQRNVRIVPTTN